MNFVERTLRAGLAIVVLATIIPYGAVNPFWFYVAVILNGALFALTLAIPFRNEELLRVYRAALLILLLTCAYLLVQAAPFNPNPVENPIWKTVHDLLKLHGGSISVDPATTFATIPAIVHPFLIFMAVLVLHQTDEAAISLWRRLALLGASVAALGLVQFVFFPGRLLLGEKTHYLDSVTGTFVNRNNASTLFGLTVLVLAGVLVRYFQQIFLYGDFAHLPEQVRRRRQSGFFFFLGLSAVALVALFLTKSRGGLISAFVPLLLLATWFGYTIVPPTAAPRVRIGFALAAAGAIFVLFAVLGAQSLFRLEQGGIDDDRWCVFKSTFAAIKDYPWFGTGFGTFEQVFPVYRDPACGLSGLWDRTHNSFLEGYLGMGLPFALLVAIIVLYLLRIFTVGYRTRRRFRIVPLIGVGMLLLVILHSLVDFPLQIPGVAAYFAAAIGATVCISLGRRRSTTRG